MKAEPKTLALAALAIVALALAAYFLAPAGGGPGPEKQTDYTQFIKDLTAANKTYIIMDLRGANATARSAIMQCGLDLASSVPLAPKNVSVMALESQGCLTESSNQTISYCEALSSNGAAFQITAGNGTVSYYPGRMVIALATYNASSPCSVNEVQN